jgi:TRAP-type C4-dicarboxylate transport system substrate-binding protein
MLSITGYLVAYAEAAPKKPIELVFSSYMPATLSVVLCAVDWTKKIEKATNGRVKFKYYYGGTLIGPRQQLVELKKGNADITEVSAHLQPATFQMQVGQQRFFYGVKDMASAYRIYRQLNKDIPELAKEWADVKTLVYRGVGEQHLHSTKAVHSLKDIKGLQVRTAGPWLKQTFKTLGAAGVSMPATELYISLQKGIVDADVHPMEFLKTFKTAEIQPYTTSLGLFDGVGSRLCMNWDSFNRLPPDIQKIIDDSLPQFERDYIVNMNRINKEGYEYAVGLDHKFLQLSQKDLKAFYAVVTEEAKGMAAKLDAKGLPGTKMFERARELVAASK